MADISRRDFLKILSLSPMAALVRQMVGASRLTAGGNPPNIVILVFDAWSADHMSLHGYPRRTMPNVEQFAEKAVVYHRHYSAGTFTMPGTASLLTGLHPWSHRALTLGGEIDVRHREHQIFHVVSPTHSTLGYAQNQYADLLLFELARDLDQHVSIDSFSLARLLTYSSEVFRNDPQIAYASFENDIFLNNATGADGSLFVGALRRLTKWRTRKALDAEYRMTYPRGLPSATNPFTLEDVVDGAIGILGGLQQPSLAYLHFFPPHGFYRPKGKYNRSFADGWSAQEKPVHALVGAGALSFAELENCRLKYDQYLASWDAEVGRLLDYLRTSGILESSYVIITSDHGELFERGVVGHYCPLIYDPLVHVPLLISRPGQQNRVDVHTPTSSVDLLPTLASLVGGDRPDWAEGQLLPELGGTPDKFREIYTLDAKTNSAFAPLTRVSLALQKSGYRMTYYEYPNVDYRNFELYDLDEDPAELNDLSASEPQISAQMREELLQKLADINRPMQP